MEEKRVRVREKGGGGKKKTKPNITAIRRAGWGKKKKRYVLNGCFCTKAPGWQHLRPCKGEMSEPRCLHSRNQGELRCHTDGCRRTILKLHRSTPLMICNRRGVATPIKCVAKSIKGIIGVVRANYSRVSSVAVQCSLVNCYYRQCRISLLFGRFVMSWHFAA